MPNVKDLVDAQAFKKLLDELTTAENKVADLKPKIQAALKANPEYKDLMTTEMFIRLHNKAVKSEAARFPDPADFQEKESMELGLSVYFNETESNEDVKSFGALMKKAIDFNKFPWIEDYGMEWVDTEHGKSDYYLSLTVNREPNKDEANELSKAFQGIVKEMKAKHPDAGFDMDFMPVDWDLTSS